ncbi:MAG: hypothetical protein QM791_16430 [Ferruginibacter sp.]
MPRIIHPSILSGASPLKFNAQSGCNFSDPSANVMEQSPAPVQSVRDCIDRYEQFVNTSVAPGEADKVVRYSNFRIQDILLMISENLDCSFLRIYNGIDADGNHFKIMLPVQQDAAGVTKQQEDTLYIMDCCRCKPDCLASAGF